MSFWKLEEMETQRWGENHIFRRLWRFPTQKLACLQRVRTMSVVPSKDPRPIPRCFCWFDCAANGLSYADQVQLELILNPGIWHISDNKLTSRFQNVLKFCEFFGQAAPSFARLNPYQVTSEPSYKRIIECNTNLILGADGGSVMQATCCASKAVFTLEKIGETPCLPDFPDWPWNNSWKTVFFQRKFHFSRSENMWWSASSSRSKWTTCSCGLATIYDN